MQEEDTARFARNHQNPRQYKLPIGNIVLLYRIPGYAIGQVDQYLKPGFAINIFRIKRLKHVPLENDLTEIEHQHDFVETVFTRKGKGVKTISNHEYEVSDGDIFIIQGFQSLYFRDAGKAEIINVMYDPVKSPGPVSPDVKTVDGYSALVILESRYRNRVHFKTCLI